MSRRLPLLAFPLAVAVVATFTVMALAPPSRNDGGLVGALRPGVAVARRMITPDFDPALTLRHNHRQIFASGHHGCETPDRWRIEVRITQDDALAEGFTQGFCRDAIRPWQVTANTTTPETFEAGTAEACGFYVLRNGGTITDSFTWCEEVTLV